MTYLMLYQLYNVEEKIQLLTLDSRSNQMPYTKEITDIAPDVGKYFSVTI